MTSVNSNRSYNLTMLSLKACCKVIIVVQQTVRCPVWNDKKREIRACKNVKKKKKRRGSYNPNFTPRAWDTVTLFFLFAFFLWADRRQWECERGERTQASFLVFIYKEKRKRKTGPTFSRLSPRKPCILRASKRQMWPALFHQVVTR